jgi:hypothetical protein
MNTPKKETPNPGKKTLMKTKSPLFPSIGALLALLVFVTLPTSTALAACGTVDDVDISFGYGGPTGVQVTMTCAYPAGAIIFYTVNGPNPTHSGSTPGPGTYIYSGPVSVPYGHCIDFSVRAWKPGIPCWYDSVNITYAGVCNPL